MISKPARLGRLISGWVLGVVRRQPNFIPQAISWNTKKITVLSSARESQKMGIYDLRNVNYYDYQIFYPNFRS